MGATTCIQRRLSKWTLNKHSWPDSKIHPKCSFANYVNLFPSKRVVSNYFDMFTLQYPKQLFSFKVQIHTLFLILSSFDTLRKYIGSIAHSKSTLSTFCFCFVLFFEQGSYQSRWIQAPTSPYKSITHSKQFSFLSGITVIFFSVAEFKGALDNFSLIPNFFQKSWDFYTIEVFTYVVTACLILLATST